MREAVLDELGLMPLWRLRSLAEAMPDALVQSEESSIPADAELTVMDVLRADGARGWVLMQKAPVDEAAVLFSNMLNAMRLRKTGSRLIDYTRLSESMASGDVQWLWQAGEIAAHPVFESGVPVFVSAHPGELMARPLAKAELWADWCNWLQKQK